MPDNTTDEPSAVKEVEELIVEKAGESTIPDEVTETAIELLDQYDRGAVERAEPSHVAAGAVYMSYLLVSEGKTQQEVAEIFDSSIASVRNHYMGILESIGAR